MKLIYKNLNMHLIQHILYNFLSFNPSFEIRKQWFCTFFNPKQEGSVWSKVGDENRIRLTPKFGDINELCQ